MNKRVLIITSVLMFLLGCAVTSLYLYLYGSQSLEKTTTTSTTKSIIRSENIDKHFIEQMIPHHEDAITMAKIALTKSQRPEIKTLSKSIIDSQSREITQMKDWYKLWFGEEVPVTNETIHMHGMGRGMHMGMMGDESDMEALENAEDFDKAFIEEMIPHHQMAVMMATMLQRSTDREEMKTLSQEINAAQTKEIHDMRIWYLAWYQ